jgi:hypothetical protein
MALDKEHALSDDIFTIRDIIDSQLETSDDVEIGRVADIEAEWREDGSLVLASLVSGPQALTARVSSRLTPFASWLFRDRFDHRIPIKDVECFGPTLRLCGRADDYPVGSSELWIAKYILRWIPGSGYR